MYKKGCLSLCKTFEELQSLNIIKGRNKSRDLHRIVHHPGVIIATLE